MNAVLKLREPMVLLWIFGGVVLGAAASMNPFYHPHITPGLGIVAWFVDLALVLLFAGHPVSARAGALVGGLFFAVPCFLDASPLCRFLLMCSMTLLWAVIALPLLRPHSPTLRGHLNCFFTWLGTREVRRRARSFDGASFRNLIVAMVVLAAAMACVKGTPAAGPWLPVRWLAAGIMILAFAEMATATHDVLTALMGIEAPSLLRSPWVARSLGEFWARRWNPAASQLGFRVFFFAPMARRGIAVAVCAAFLASGVAHVLLVFMASGRWGISLVCGGFFFVQPALIFAERRMRVRRWRPVAARAWTLAALAIVSPLFIEPTLQLIEQNWGPPDSVAWPVAMVFMSAMAVVLFFSLGSLISCPAWPSFEASRSAKGVNTPPDQGVL